MADDPERPAVLAADSDRVVPEEVHVDVAGGGPSHTA